MHVANRLLDIRRTRGLTQDQVAVAVDVDRSTVSRWESCEIPIADRHKVRLAELLTVTPAQLMGWAPFDALTEAAA